MPRKESKDLENCFHISFLLNNISSLSPQILKFIFLIKRRVFSFSCLRTQDYELSQIRCRKAQFRFRTLISIKLSYALRYGTEENLRFDGNDFGQHRKFEIAF